MVLRTIIAGRGVQGLKREQICGKDFVAFVDPHSELAKYDDITQVPLDIYDAVLACIPDEPKESLVEYCLKHGKHVLVEKPLWMADSSSFSRLQAIADNSDAICYTAYNHRFEPHFKRMKELIDTENLGKIYRCRMFYGNGTAQLVRESEWRDQGAGVLPDLGSHLIDTCNYWFGDQMLQGDWRLISANCFENKSPDHVVIGGAFNNLSVELEMTMLMWRNHFTCDILGEHGSAHIRSLCKWGPSSFVVRERIRPSGRPTEREETLVLADPTWQLEHDHFLELIKQGARTDFSADCNLNQTLRRLEEELRQ